MAKFNLNDTDPAAPAGAAAVHFQAVPPPPDPDVPRDISAYVPAADASDPGVVKLSGNATDVLHGDGSWSAAAGLTPSDATPAMDGAGAAGSSTTYSRGDHVHPKDATIPSPSGATPAMDGTGAAGTSAAYSRGDHVHPTDTSRAAVSAIPSPSSATPAMDGAGAAGSSANYSRADHVHPSDTSRAPLDSPALTGTPTTPTPTLSDNSTKIASTAYVQGQGFLTGGAGSGFAWGGDGSDGAVDLDGTNTYSWAVLTHGIAPFVYYLKRNIYPSTLRVRAGVYLITTNFQIFASISVTVEGWIGNDGGKGQDAFDASGATGGSSGTGGQNNGCINISGTNFTSAVNAGTTGANPVKTPNTTGAPNGVAGKNGTTGAGASGNAGNGGSCDGSYAFCILTYTGLAGKAGGNGGSSGATGGGAGGAAGSSTSGLSSTTTFPRTASAASTMTPVDQYYGTNISHWVTTPNPGGGGGGCGAGDGTNAGGGGGASGGNGGGGGHVVIFSPTISIASGGMLLAGHQLDRKHLFAYLWHLICCCGGPVGLLHQHCRVGASQVRDSLPITTGINFRQW